MKTFLKTALTANIFTTLAGYSANATPSMSSSAKCAAFPDIPWWNISHRKVASYVEVKHGGDWTSYITKVEKRLSIARCLARRGEGIANFPTAAGGISATAVTNGATMPTCRVLTAACSIPSSMARIVA